MNQTPQNAMTSPSKSRALRASSRLAFQLEDFFGNAGGHKHAVFFSV